MQRKAGRFFRWVSKSIDLSGEPQPPMRYVCGVDVSYRGSEAFGSSVVYDLPLGKVVESVCVRTRVHFPYVPTLLFLREAVPMIKALSRVLHPKHLIVVDANGILHPFRSGLACYIGLYFDKPTIGIAKKLLCGEIRTRGGVETIFLDGDPVGFTFTPKRDGKKLFVSPAHKISLESTLKLCGEVLDGIPLPTRLAHEVARRCVG